MNTWEDALDRLDVSWCQGRGCMIGGRPEHEAGFRSFNPPTVHLTPEPEEKGEELHKALRLIGTVAAEQVWPDREPIEQQAAAWDFATDQMRAHKHPVPKAVTDARPGAPDTDLKLFIKDAQAEAEAPGMAEQEDDG